MSSSSSSSKPEAGGSKPGQSLLLPKNEWAIGSVQQCNKQISLLKSANASNTLLGKDQTHYYENRIDSGMQNRFESIHCDMSGTRTIQYENSSTNVKRDAIEFTTPSGINFTSVNNTVHKAILTPTSECSAFRNLGEYRYQHKRMVSETVTINSLRNSNPEVGDHLIQYYNIIPLAQQRELNAYTPEQHLFSINDSSNVKQVNRTETKTLDDNNKTTNETGTNLSRRQKSELSQQYKHRNSKLGNSLHLSPFIGMEHKKWDHPRKMPSLVEISQPYRNESSVTTSTITATTSASSVHHHIINLDTLPVKYDLKRSQNDKFYSVLKSDAVKESQNRAAIQTIVPARIGIPASGSRIVQIRNGQLNDTSSGIQLLDKPTVSRIQAATAPNNLLLNVVKENKVIETLSKNEKAQELKERISQTGQSLQHLEQENNGCGNRSLLEYSHLTKKAIEKRSKPIGSSDKLRFKFQPMKKHKRLHEVKPGQSVIKPPKNQNWLSDALKGEVDIGSFVTGCHRNRKSRGSRDGSGSGSASTTNATNSRRESAHSDDIAMKDTDTYFEWNSSKKIGRLPNSRVIVQVNELNEMEVSTLAIKQFEAKLDQEVRPSRNEYLDTSKIRTALPCGHSDSAACFEEIIHRLYPDDAKYLVNDRKPIQFFSMEFRTIIAILVQNNNGDCGSITMNDIRTGLLTRSLEERVDSSVLFNWSRFVDYHNNRNAQKQFKLAATNLFSYKLPDIAENTFVIGQKLEAIDPQNSDLFCVCTIIEKCGYRIKLHFDGCSPSYDFWTNADSKNIFPAGFCQRTSRHLEVPAGAQQQCRSSSTNRTTAFNWKEYLMQTKSKTAHPACFTHLNNAKTNANPFKMGMKFEAEQLRHRKKMNAQIKMQQVCYAATVGDVIDSRILVKFDGYDVKENYWTEITSPSIHPIDWHKQHDIPFQPPIEFKQEFFKWEQYLRDNYAEGVPREAFHARLPNPFKVGMAIEVVDPKNPSLIRPAAIVEINGYDIKVLFIGWPDEYAYWVKDDSYNIFPPGYAKKTNHPIECPIDSIYKYPIHSCGVSGCRGIGNGKKPDLNRHSTFGECPYNLNFWKCDLSTTIPNRIKRNAVNESLNSHLWARFRTKTNPAMDRAQVSLQSALSPIQLASMTRKEVELFRRLQVSADFLLANQKSLAGLRNEWVERMKPTDLVTISAAAENPLRWSIDKVVKFITEIPNCSDLGGIFVEHEIDGSALLSLRQDDMIHRMGLSIGAAIKIHNRIVFLREECNANYIRYE